MSATATRSKLVAIPRYEGGGGGGTSKTGSGPAASTVNRKETCVDRAARDQHRITVMLIIVVVVFLICQLPQAIQHIYGIYHVIVRVERTVYQKQVMKITGNVFNLLVMVNCAANFILYSALSTKFRATFSQLFCRCSDASSWATHHRACCCCCCCPGAESGGRDLTPKTTATGQYTAIVAGGGRPVTRLHRKGRDEADRSRSQPASATRERNDIERMKEDDGVSALATDNLIISGHSAVEEPDDITHL